MRPAAKRRAVLAAAACLTLGAAAGCSAHAKSGATGPGSPAGIGRTTPPQAQQAYAVAQKEFGLLAGGGWAAAWSLWTPSAQQAVPQAEFVHVNTTCRPVLGVPYVIDDSEVADPDTIRISWHRQSAQGTNTMHYQGGRWRFTPDAHTLADYRIGADRLIQQRRAAGSCH